MCSISQIVLEAASGRIRLTLEAKWLGADLLVTISGGKAHLGAMALARPDLPSQLAELPGHKDGIVAKELAEYLATAFDTAVAVSCGIHYDSLALQEIELVKSLAQVLAQKLTATLAADG